MKRPPEQEAALEAWKKGATKKGKAQTRDLKPTDEEKAAVRTGRRVSFRVGGVEVLREGEGYHEWLALVRVADPPKWCTYATGSAVGSDEAAIAALRRRAGLDEALENKAAIEDLS